MITKRLFSIITVIAVGISPSLELESTIALAANNPLITPAPTPTTPSVEHELERRQVAGGPGTPILSTLMYNYTDLPYQVYPYPVLRGPQVGYNICNSTTLGPGSMCQTLIFNGPDDFCLWGSDIPNGFIGYQEAYVTAYCSKPYHGTRVIPDGMVTGLQWMNTSGYIQIVGFINNVALNLNPTDYGGELDPHGADLQGNPLGGVVYSNGTIDSDGQNLTQVMNWNSFVGNGIFCFKACFNNITSPDYCENRYDIVGCDYNMPNDAQNGTFLACQGDVQTPVGTYVSDGQTLTWSQPDTLTTDPPYTPITPNSSNCITYQSTDLFPLAIVTTTSDVPASTTPAAAGPTNVGGNLRSSAHKSQAGWSLSATFLAAAAFMFI